MKKFFYFLLVALIIVAGIIGYMYWQSTKTATSAELQEFRTEINHRMDSVNMRLDTVNERLKTIEENVKALRHESDTTQAGQAVIYKEITKKNTQSFLDKIIDLLK